MNAFTRRRFLLHLAAIGGILAFSAGQELEARPLPDPELQKKMDDAIDKVFKAKAEPTPPPKPEKCPPHYPTPGRMPYPRPGVVAPPKPQKG